MYSEDLDILDGGEVKSLDYYRKGNEFRNRSRIKKNRKISFFHPLFVYKKLAASRLLDVERISEDLNSSNLDLEQMRTVC